MRRALRITIFVIVILAALLAVNTIVLEGQTRPAERTEADGKLVQASSGQLQYVDREPTDRPGGREGEPIVLLHCYACSSRWWDPLTPVLDRRHRVIAFDLIGHGGSAKPATGYEIAAQAAAIAEALNKLGIRQATVVGHGMGGLVATSLAEQASELVDRVVLIGTPSEPGEAELPFGARASAVPVLGDAIWRLKIDSMVKSAYESSFAPGADVSGLFDDPNRVVDDLDAMTYTSYKQSKTAMDDFLDAGSTASRLTAIGVPVLAIDGALDQILEPERVLGDYQAVPGARIVSIEDAGNSPNVEQPREVADAILPFADAGGQVAPLPTSEPQAGGKGADAGGRGHRGRGGRSGNGAQRGGG